MDFSHTVGKHVSQSQALARTLLLGGRQQLQGLLASAPHVQLPAGWKSEVCPSDDKDCSLEGDTVQALFELCLGLVLQLMAGHDRESYTLDGLLSLSPYFPFTPSPRSPGARLCFLPPLA